jgi:soluble lytic murein transglycosylase-like protein
MQSVKHINERLGTAVEQSWDRLPATKRLMIRGLGLFASVVGLGAVVGFLAPRAAAMADSDRYSGTAVLSEFHRLRASLDTTTGELELVKLKLARAEALLGYSTRYRIPADLAALVFDIAKREGVDPELAFRLINIESRFNTRAKSNAGAYGLAQVQVATAKFYDPDITAERLYEPELNLQIGFRYLRDLIETYAGDIKLALLAYNRGPTRVKTLMEQGHNPDNGYPSALMEGYPGGGS